MGYQFKGNSERNLNIEFISEIYKIFNAGLKKKIKNSEY